MAVVEISSAEYFAYGTQDESDEYFAAAAHAQAWRDEDDADVKGRALVTATRMLDRQKWQGEKTDPDQDGAWPRTGVAEDEPVNDEGVPLKVVHATFELALVLLNDPEAIQVTQNSSQKVSSLSAGSVSISYFRGAEGEPLRFPLPVMELIGDWLGASSDLGGIGFSSGIDGSSSFALGFGRTRGL